MATIQYGERIARAAKIRAGCSGLIFDAHREKILLTRRTDNNLWCLPGGGLDAGESAAEACIREVREETGLDVKIIRLIGIYSSPHRVIEYADGNRFQIIAMSFEVEIMGGDLTLNDEVSEFGYFTPQEIEHLTLMEHHRERIADALLDQKEAFIR
jgi:ADP-ribose pyrophosphatase YjhB (NUDIX family)